MSDRTEHGFRLGAIECIAAAEWDRGGAVIVRVGDAEVEVVSSPRGRRMYVHVRHGARTRAVVTQRFCAPEAAP